MNSSESEKDQEARIHLASVAIMQAMATFSKESTNQLSPAEWIIAFTKIQRCLLTDELKRSRGGG